jgi:hypothetical protein
MIGKPLNPAAQAFIDPANGPPAQAGTLRARSSAVEHYVDIVGVTSSNLVVPTIPPHPGHQAAPRKGRMCFKGAARAATGDGR